jgi:hypothetical protein
MKFLYTVLSLFCIQSTLVRTAEIVWFQRLPTQSKTLKLSIANLVKENNPNDQALQPDLPKLLDAKTINTLFEAEEINKSFLLYLSKDSYAFNTALYSYSANLNHHIGNEETRYTPFDLGGPLPFLFVAADHIQSCNKQLTAPTKKRPGTESCYRANGKNFIIPRDNNPNESRVDQTPQDRIDYWETSLRPTIDPMIYQSGEKNGKKWTVTELKNTAFTLLLCLHRLDPNKKLICKAVRNNYIISGIFSQPLDTIHICFSNVYNDMLSQITLLQETHAHDKDNNPKGLYIEYLDDTQQTFFENFHTWYPKQANKVLGNRFAIVQQLIAYHNKTLSKEWSCTLF